MQYIGSFSNASGECFASRARDVAPSESQEIGYVVLLGRAVSAQGARTMPTQSHKVSQCMTEATVLVAFCGRRCVGLGNRG
jgi:hypothetical protein